jgi:hypothetical protein
MHKHRQVSKFQEYVNSRARKIKRALDPPPLKWSDLRYVFDIKEDCNGKDCNGKEAIQA